MGMDDDRLNHEENVAIAADYLVSIDRLEVCDAHGVTFGGGDWALEDDFYRQVMSDRNKGKSGPVPWAADMKAKDYTDLLKEAYDGHPGDCCEACAKNMRD